eukprot:1176298-Prorocentrum_minimum.AAC.2
MKPLSGKAFWKSFINKNHKGKGSASSSKSVGELEDIEVENDESDDESPPQGVCAHVQAGGCECRSVCTRAQARGHGVAGVGCVRMCGDGAAEVWGCVRMCAGCAHAQARPVPARVHGARSCGCGGTGL